jgi:hypothetical protein
MEEPVASYLNLTSPRLDPSAVDAFRSQLALSLVNRGSNPSSIFIDTVAVTMTQHSPRTAPPALSMLDQIDPVKALAFYHARYANPSAFTYVFVGNATLDSLKPLVERYLASTPAAGQDETWKDIQPAPPTGVVERVVRTSDDGRVGEPAHVQPRLWVGRRLQRQRHHRVGPAREHGASLGIVLRPLCRNLSRDGGRRLTQECAALVLGRIRVEHGRGRRHRLRHRVLGHR